MTDALHIAEAEAAEAPARWVGWLVVILLLLHAVVLAVLVGPAAVPPMDAVAALLGRGEGDVVDIVRGVRLPRALGALSVGAGLGAAGAALQGFTRNDLAAPGLLGFSACAALGAVVALYFGLAAWIMPAALLGAAVGATITATLARRQVGAGGLILAGVGVGALATALTGLAMNLAPNPWALSELTYWLMGTLENADASSVLIALPLTLLGTAVLCWLGRDLRALSLGEDVAQSLGVSLVRLQALLIAGTALCIGAGVALAGAIGFVGLFVPHIVRRLPARMGGTANPAALVPRSALVGALFLLLTDTAVRAWSGPGTPLYLGIVTSLIGVPFFLYLATRTASP